MADFNSILSGADLHSVANGQPSIYDDEESILDRGAKFTVSAMTRAVTSALNTVPGAYNFVASAFESENKMEYIQTDEVLRSMDDNLGAYYDENRSSVDLVGDIVGSIVPGMAGVKLFNYGQRALKAANFGKPGLSLLSRMGALPDAADKYAKLAGARLATNTYTRLNGDVLKGIGAGLAQGYLEGAAFTVASGFAMKDYSPIFDEQTSGDIVKNALYGGGVIGLGVLGGVTGIQTWSKIKTAAMAADKELNPIRHVMDVPDGTPTYAKMMTRIVDKNISKATPKAPEFERAFERKMTQVDVALRKDIIGVTGNDSEVGDMLHRIIKDSSEQEAMEALPFLQEVGRMATPLKLESLIDDATKTGMDFDGHIKYLKTVGEDAGTTYLEAPTVLGIADLSKNADEVMKKVSSYKFSHTKAWNTDDMLEAESRRIWARSWDINRFPNTTIQSTDLPLLERAYTLGAKDFTVSLPDGSPVRITANDQLFDLIQEFKFSQRDLLLNDIKSGKSSVEHVAKTLNMKVSYLEGEISKSDPVSDIIADRMLTDKQLIEPRFLKLGYKPDTKLPSPAELDGMTWLTQINKLREQDHDIVTTNYFDTYLKPGTSELLPNRARDGEILGLTRYDGGAGFFAASSANYGTPGARAETLGKTTNQITQLIREKISSEHVPYMQKLLANERAGIEAYDFYRAVRSTGNKYRKVSAITEEGVEFGGNGKFIPIATGQPTGGGARSVYAAVNDNGEAELIPIITSEADEFIANWISRNDLHNTQRMNQLSVTGYDVKNMARNSGAAYFPPPSPKKYPHFAFVVDESITGLGHTEMIHAQSAEELATLAAAVPTGKGLKVYFKRDGEEFFKAHQKYDQSLGLSENYINQSLKRTGKASEFFPKYDTKEWVEEMMEWRLKSEVSLARDMISMRESKYFNELMRLADEHEAISSSKYGFTATRKYVSESQDIKNPYIDIMKTSLDIQKASDYPLWDRINNAADRGYTTLKKGIEAIWSSAKNPVDKAAEVDKTLAEAGIGNSYRDAALSLFSNHPAGQGELTRHVSAMNGLLSTFMLRTDPMNAVNNGFGHQVLLWSETRDIIKKIESGGDEFIGAFAAIGRTKIPGVAGNGMVSPAKLISRAYKDYFKNVMGDADAGALKEYFKKHGWITDISQQHRQMMDLMTFTGKETAGEFRKNAGKAADVLEKISGNKSVEEMNRFVSAHVAKQLTDLATKAGKMSEREALSYINSFVNRTNGVYLASQRPLLFSGPIGKAMGLFQTYQFTLMQHVFRHVAQGNKGQLAYLMGLQGSIYGMNGLPAFNAINQHIVGDAYGNREHTDIVSSTFGITGRDTAEWMMYGLASNMLVDPDLKTNLYTRGDINPRHVTIVPTSFKDLPIVSSTANIFNSLSGALDNVSAGAPVGYTITQALEHMQLSRPLAGMAVVAQGYSTTQQGNIMAENDFYSAMSALRILGARPLDEAINRDAFYRVHAYEGAMYARTKKIGKAIQDTIRAGGEISREDYYDFMDKYVRAGGDQKNFQKFMFRNMKKATKNQVVKLAEHADSPYGRYMQKMMSIEEYEE